MDQQRSEGQEVIARFWEAAEKGDLEALRELTTDDATMTWPQSGERFQGRDNALGAMGTMEEGQTPAGEPRVIGCGDVWVVMQPLRVGEETHQYVGVFELRDGRIAASTEYFAAPFPADPRRAAFAEKEALAST